MLSSHIMPDMGVNRAQALKIRSPTHNGWAGRALSPLPTWKRMFYKTIIYPLKVIKNEIYLMVFHDYGGSIEEM